MLFIKMTLPGDPTRILNAGKYQEGPEGGELLLGLEARWVGLARAMLGRRHGETFVSESTQLASFSVPKYHPEPQPRRWLSTPVSWSVPPLKIPLVSGHS